MLLSHSPEGLMEEEEGVGDPLSDTRVLVLPHVFWYSTSPSPTRVASESFLLRPGMKAAALGLRYGDGDSFPVFGLNSGVMEGAVELRARRILARAFLVMAAMVGLMPKLASMREDIFAGLKVVIGGRVDWGEL